MHLSTNRKRNYTCETKKRACVCSVSWRWASAIILHTETSPKSRYLHSKRSPKKLNGCLICGAMLTWSATTAWRGGALYHGTTSARGGVEDDRALALLTAPGGGVASSRVVAAADGRPTRRAACMRRYGGDGHAAPCLHSVHDRIGCVDACARHMFCLVSSPSWPKVA